MNYKERMLEELLNLKERITKIENFNKTLSEEDKKLLDEQRTAMCQYFSVLHTRLVKELEDKVNAEPMHSHCDHSITTELPSHRHCTDFVNY